jgi:hypothetical protein
MYKVNDFFTFGCGLFRIFFVHNDKYYLQQCLSTLIFQVDDDFLDNYCKQVEMEYDVDDYDLFPYIRYIMTDKKITPFREGTNRTVDLYQIMDIHTGALGGWIENYGNLEQSETAWIKDDVYVYGSSRVENSIISFSTIVDSTIKGMIIDDCTIINSALVNDEPFTLLSIKGIDIKNSGASDAFIYNNKLYSLIVD